MIWLVAALTATVYISYQTRANLVNCFFLVGETVLLKLTLQGFLFFLARFLRRFERSRLPVFGTAVSDNTNIIAKIFFLSNVFFNFFPRRSPLFFSAARSRPAAASRRPLRPGPATRAAPPGRRWREPGKAPWSGAPLAGKGRDTGIYL